MASSTTSTDSSEQLDCICGSEDMPGDCRSNGCDPNCPSCSLCEHGIYIDDCGSCAEQDN